MAGRFATPLLVALCLGAGACVRPAPPPVMPPFELAPTNDQVRAALSARFAATRDPAGAPCTDDFTVSAIAIRENAYKGFHPGQPTWGMSASAIYTATLRKPTTDLATLQVCFATLSQNPDDVRQGAPLPVFASAGLERAGDAWTLNLSVAQKPESILLAAAAPHPFKIALGRQPPR